MGPRISIITPCYNHERFLREYFQSLLEQSYRNIELIVIDDCSQDNSWEVIREFEPALKSAFPHVVLERNEQNLGPFRTEHRAAEHLSGDFVSVLESDDFYYPTKVEENIDYLIQHPDVGAVHSDCDQLEPDGSKALLKRMKNRTPPQGDIYEELLIGNGVTRLTLCCRTEIFRKAVDPLRYEAAGYRMIDVPSHLDISRHTQFGYIRRALGCSRVVAGSMSRQADARRMYEFELSAAQIKVDFMKTYGASPEIEQEVWRRYYRVLFIFGFRLGMQEECRTGYRWLVEHYPKEYRRFSNRLRSISTGNRVLWKLIRGLEPGT
jgi:glycosyltransferase involved in cell wall biosynthesis